MTDTTLPTPVDANRPDRPGGGAPVASVDYEFAKRTGRAIVNPGPQVSSDEAAAIVADLRAAAASAVGPVAETSALTAPADAPAPLVVDRAGWISANVDSFRSMLDPVVDKLNATKKSSTNATAAAIGGKVTGAEMGGLLAFLSSKVLGQYDLAPGGTPRLLLVAPNIVAVERELELVPGDFRLWVCLHEETHRVQFTAVPWLRGYLNTQIGEVVATADVDGAALAGMLREAVKRISEAARPGSLLLVYDHMIDEDQPDLQSLITSLNVALVTPGGSEYTVAECREWLEGAGFRFIRAHRLPIGNDTVVVAERTG